MTEDNMRFLAEISAKHPGCGFFMMDKAAHMNKKRRILKVKSKNMELQNAFLKKKMAMMEEKQKTIIIKT